MLQLLTVRSHHEKISIALVLHNFFPQSKCMRILGLNCTYYIIYRVVRDSSSLITLNKQNIPVLQKFYFQHTVRKQINPVVTFYWISIRIRPRVWVLSQIFLTMKLLYIVQWTAKRSLVAIMKLTKLHDNRHKFSVLSSSKLALGKAILKHDVDKEFINLISELCLKLTEEYVQLQEVVKQHTKQHHSIARALARSNNEGIYFKFKKNVFC